MAKSKDLIALVFETNHDILLQHTTIATPQGFFDLLTTSTNDPEPAHTYPSMDCDRTAIVDGSNLANLLDTLFVRSWDIYLAAKEEQARQLTLKEFVDLTLKESATAPVAMNLDQIATDSPELATSFSEQVTKSTSKLRGQAAQLQKQQKLPTNAKKKLRGAPKSGAQNKKKSDPVKKNPAQNGQPAADAANGSTAGNRTRGKKQPSKRNARLRNNNAPRT
jgi:hypothetical protein